MLCKYLLPLLFCCASMVALADGGSRSINLFRNGEELMSLNISDDLEMTVQGDEIRVWSEIINYYFDLDGLSWQFSENLIKKPTDNQSDSKVFAAGCVLKPAAVLLTGLAQSTPVVLADLQGRVLTHAVAEGDYEVSLENIPHGVYILRFGNETIKISVK